MCDNNNLKKSRRFISLAIIVVVIATSVALGLTHRVHPGEIPLRTTSDGSGGVIVVWQDKGNLYAQRIDSEGKSLWTEGGVLVCTEPMKPKQFALVGDGSGGAIITWDDRTQLSDDRRDYEAYFAPIPVYSQRISARGEPLWGEQGIATGVNQRYVGYLPQAVPDGTGGAIVAWDDFQPVFRALRNNYLRLQKINPEGNPVWGDKGILVCSSPPYRPVTPEEKERGVKGTWTRHYPAYRGYHSIVDDGSGGAIVVWKEDAEGPIDNICAQRVDAEGTFVWQARGILACTTRSSYILVISDGAGGTIIATCDAGGGFDLPHAQRIGASGKLLWSEVGLSLWKQHPQVVSDGFGGAIFLEQEEHPLPGNPYIRQVTLYAQRLDLEGQNLWQEKPLFTTTGEGLYTLQSAIAGDGSGGALITWRTWKKERILGGKVYAQKLDAKGNPSWLKEGIAVFSDPDLKYQGPPQVVTDDSGGGIVVAAVGRNALRGDIVYAQRLDANGNRLWEDGIKINQ